MYKECLSSNRKQQSKFVLNFSIEEMVQPKDVEQKEICEEQEVREYRNIRRIRVLCNNCSQIIGYYNDFRPYDEGAMKVFIGNLESTSYFQLSYRCLECKCGRLLGNFAEDGVHLYILRSIMKLDH